jgi:sulfur relay (sulfurtransferase) complex TusBCD TusD component (DsrE family)
MDNDDLPDEIVQPLLQLGRALIRHARTHRDTSLAEHEDGVLAAWRRVSPALLESVLQVATTGLENTARPLASRCPRCQQRRGVQSQRKRQVQTRLGPIRLKRWWHHCWTCGRGWSPPDQALGLAPYQQTSTGLARWHAALGAVTTFREAARLLDELAGVEVGSETLRTQAERIGTELEGQQRRAMAEVEATHEPPGAEHDPAPGMLVVETDGVMVRYRDRHLDGALVEGDWHEVKLGLVGGWLDGHLRKPSYVAAREAAPAFARRLGAEAARRGALDVLAWHPWDGTPAELRAVVVLGDGAKWIWEHVATLFGGERTEIVDWYHASEHVWTVAKALHGDDTPETKAWAKAGLDRLWQSGPKPLLNWFDATQPDTPAAAAALKRERGYFSTNAQRMHYPSLRQQDLPIGSGAVEASAKHLVQQRMKRAGSRWSNLGASAILDLRCHLLSGRSLESVA